MFQYVTKRTSVKSAELQMLNLLPSPTIIGVKRDRSRQNSSKISTKRWPSGVTSSKFSAVQLRDNYNQWSDLSHNQWSDLSASRCTKTKTHLGVSSDIPSLTTPQKEESMPERKNLTPSKTSNYQRRGRQHAQAELKSDDGQILAVARIMKTKNKKKQKLEENKRQKTALEQKQNT